MRCKCKDHREDTMGVTFANEGMNTVIEACGADGSVGKTCEGSNYDG